MGEVLATNKSSSNPSIVYRVMKGGDGVIYCDCPGWKMRKDCKHLKAYHSSSGTKATPPALMGAPAVKMTKSKSSSLFVPSTSGPMLGTDPVSPDVFHSDDFQSQPWYQGCGSEIESEKPEDIMSALDDYEKSGEWFAEPKLDGIYIAVFSDGKRNRFWSRNMLEKDYGLKDKPLPAGTLLIGELGAGSEEAIERRNKMGHDFVDVHGVLTLEYNPIIHLDETERREYLVGFHKTLSKDLQKHFMLVPRWTDKFRSRYESEHEGLVLKRRKGGAYIGRGTKPENWKKAKKWFEVDMVIMDIRISTAETKKSEPMTKDLHMGQYVNGKLVPLTRVGSMTSAWSKEFAQNFPKWKGKVMKIKANCQFKSGALRHAAMIDMRDDKDAKDCVFDPSKINE
jgi:hypothetical protein